MNQTSILIVDDDATIRKLVSVNLQQRNYAVQEAANGRAAISIMEHAMPDLVILDLVMPEVSGNDVCIWIRQQGVDIPVVVLSAHGEEELMVRALDSGADDYITKPFRIEEFLARLRALTRRFGIADLSGQEQGNDDEIKIEGLEINLKARRVFVDDVDIHLTRTEFALVAALAANFDAILTHDELLARVWGEEYRGSSHYLHVYLGRIRKKMGEKYSPLLETVAGMGYILHSTLQNVPH